MTLAKKVGQCFTFSWRGSMITASVGDVITKLHAGGLRIEPYTTESATAGYYGRTLGDSAFIPPRDYREIAQTYFKAKLPGVYSPPAEYAHRLNALKQLAMQRPSGVPLRAGTVVCTFGAVPNSLRAAAALLYGKHRAVGTWPLHHFAKPRGQSKPGNSA